MSKRSLLFAMGLWAVFALSACIKEVTLTPYELPDLVESYIRKVEAFEADSALFVASDEGVMIQMGDQRVLFNHRNYGELTEVNWDEAKVLYASYNKRFWVIDDTTYYQLGDGYYYSHTDATVFYGPTKSYAHYAISPEGELYRAGFYKEYWDPNSGNFYSDYYIGIYRYVGNPNNTWEAFETELTINSQQLADPTFTFNAEGDMVFYTNPSFVVANLGASNESIETYAKQGDGFKFKSAYYPYLGSDGTLYGLNIEPDLLRPVTQLYSVQVADLVVQSDPLSDGCDLPETSQGLVKWLEWRNDEVVLYARNFTNNLSDDKSVLGYIVSRGLNDATCEVKTLRSGDLLKTSESISDLDVIGQTVYIGTRNGLLIYDLDTDAMQSFLLNLVITQEPQ